MLMQACAEFQCCAEPQVSRRVSPLSLGGILAVVTDVDSSLTGGGHHCIQSRHGRLAHYFQRLIVARDEHAHVVWSGGLQTQVQPSLWHRYKLMRFSAVCLVFASCNRNCDNTVTKEMLGTHCNVVPAH